MSIEVIDWNDFMGNRYQRPSIYKKLETHFKQNQFTYKVLGSMLIIFIGMSNDFAFAADIDTKAREIYDTKLVKFGKWAIIIKGGWDTIHKALKEDFDGAKRSLLGYLMVLCILLGFPWACDQVEDAFKG